MKLKAVSGTMLMLLLIGMLTLAFNIQSVESESRTWTVDDDGQADFYTIQEAISAANPGDTILVSKGTYYENVDVNKPLNIKGAGASETIVYASNSKDHVFEVKANYVNITGFTLANASEIAVPHEPWASGILLDHVNNCAIFENVVTNNTEGINVFYSNFNSIQNNMVKRANLFGGIHLLVSSFNILTNNIVIDNVVYGVFFRGQSNNNIFSSNVVSHTTHRPGETGVGTGFYCCGSNNIITNNTICLNERGGIELNGADNNKVIGNLLVSNEYFNIAVSPGIDKLVYNNNTIHHNNFINDKGRQARIWNSLNVWDNGYPPGGNYWSDYNGTDFYSGPYQNVTGSDGIGDTPYIIGENNQDNYPLMSPLGDVQLPVADAGGKAVPKLQIPWTWLSTFILPLVLTAVYVKKRKKQQAFPLFYRWSDCEYFG